LLKLKGGKPKFAQSTGGKPKFSQITGGKICYEGLKPKNLQITRTESKKNILQGGKLKMTYITWGKTLLTLKTITLKQSKLYIDMCEDVDYDLYFETEGLVA